MASFKLTYRCNLACVACPYHQLSGREKDHIKWDSVITALDALKRMGVMIVVFEGGEPLLWRDGPYNLNHLIIHAKRHFSRVAVTTNGTFPLDVPADILWVSVDGVKESHDRLRSCSFDRVWSNLLMSTRSRLFIHFTVNRENRKDIRPLLRMLKDIRAFVGMTIQLFYPYGRGEGSLALNQTERRAALEAVIEMKKQGYPILNSTGRLRAMIDNEWRCHDDMLINVDPDGTITQGCYVKSRGRINCRACGFSPVAELSGALDLHPGSLMTGWSIFIK